MSKTENKIKSSVEQDMMNNWFNELIDNLKSDKFLLQEDFASNETKNLYKDLMNSDIEPLMRRSSDTSKMYFIERLTKDYLNEFKKSEINYKKLALDIGNSKVLTWIELADDDEDSEDKLIMAEAKINAKYYHNGFHISTTIVEERDNIDVPEHYYTLSI